MRATLRLTILTILTASIFGCGTVPEAKFKIGSVSFSNFSTNDISVDRIMCDGKEFPAACGFLGSGGGGKTIGFTFPEIMPEAFTVEFEQDGRPYTNRIKAGGAAEAIKKAAPAKEITLYFIYSDTRVRFKIPVNRADC